MSLNDVWEGAAASPFYPAVPKERQFLVAFSLLLIGDMILVTRGLKTSLTVVVLSLRVDELIRSQCVVLQFSLQRSTHLA